MNIEEAVTLAKSGKAVLFTGAGFSYGAQNSVEKLDHKVPIADAFSRYLGQIAEATQTYPLNTMAQYFKKKKGDHKLVEELLGCFSVTSVSDSHREIASIPWRRVYTTNYDNCFEKAASEKGHVWTPLTTSHGVSASKQRVVHINGHIFSLDINNLENQIKLTHSSYSIDSFEKSQWSQQLRQDFDSAKAVVFVGYSMADLDVSRVLRNVDALKKKTIFIVGPNDDDISTSFLSDFGEVYKIGVDGFSSICASVDVAPEAEEHEYTWLRRYQEAPKITKPNDTACFNLLTKGILLDGHLDWSISNYGAVDNNYAVRRPEVNFILDQIESGRTWFLIHSDMGNGKSIFKSQMSIALNQLNYKVFWDTEVEINKQGDIRRLALEDGKIAVFLDETSNRFETIDGLLQLNLPNILVFVSTRSTLYELGEKLYEEYMPSNYLALDLNKIGKPEANDFARILDNLGLWGSLEQRRNLSSHSERAQFISQECGGSISKLIMTLFEESELGSRFVSEAKKFLLDRSDTARIVTLSFLLNIIGHSPTFDLLSKITDLDVWNVSRKKEFLSAREFVSVERNQISTRSSVLSSYLLKEAFEPSELIWHIREIVVKLGQIKRDSTMHHVFTELQRFPMIERVIKGRNSRLAIIAYFETVKDDVSFCKQSPDFWMHYAMARMTYEEWPMSEAHFKQARKLAIESNNEKAKRDIENHFAKFLIASRTKSSEYSDYYMAFKQAHEVLIQQMNKDTNKFFPYRQAGEYVEFISARKKDLNESEIVSFINACKQVQSAIANITGSLKGSPIVGSCGEKMARAIEIAKSSSHAV